jgi:hypothetical protein
MVRRVDCIRQALTFDFAAAAARTSVRSRFVTDRRSRTLTELQPATGGGVRRNVGLQAFQVALIARQLIFPLPSDGQGSCRPDARQSRPPGSAQDARRPGLLEGPSRPSSSPATRRPRAAPGHLAYKRRTTLSGWKSCSGSKVLCRRTTLLRQKSCLRELFRPGVPNEATKLDHKRNYRGTGTLFPDRRYGCRLAKGGPPWTARQTARFGFMRSARSSPRRSSSASRSSSSAPFVSAAAITVMGDPVTAW